MGYRLAEQGRLVDLAQHFAQPPELEQRLSETFYCWDDGRTFGTQGANETMLLFYSRTAFEEAGLDPAPAVAAQAWDWDSRNLVFGLLLTGVMLPYAVTLIPTFSMWSIAAARRTARRWEDDHQRGGHQGVGRRGEPGAPSHALRRVARGVRRVAQGYGV